MLHTYASCLRALWVADQRTLHLCGANTMARHVDDIIHSAGDPVVSVRVAAGAVAGEVVPREGAEVRRLVAVVVLPQRAHHRGPRTFQAEQPRALALQLHALLVHNGGLHPKEGQGCGSRLLVERAGQGSDEVRPRLGLPIRVYDGAVAVAHHLVVPLPRLRVDGLPHRAKHPQGAKIVLGGDVVAGAHEGAHERGRRVELSHLVLVHHVPAAACVGVCGHPLEHHLRSAVQHGPVGEVRVAGDPAAVRCAPEDVVRLVVKHVLEGGCRAYHVAARGVHHALGHASGSRGVQREERVLGVHPLAGAVGGLRGHLVLVPVVAPLHEAAVGARHGDGVVVHQHVPWPRARLLGDGARVVHDALEADGLGAAHHCAAGDEHVCFGADHALSEGVLGEAAKHHRVDGADARTRQHGQGQLQNHGRVQQHTVTLLDPLGLEPVGQLAHLILHACKRHRAVDPDLVALPVEGDVVAVTRLHVPVHAVVAHVGGASREPLDVHAALGHVHVRLHHTRAVKRGLPMELVRDFPPKRIRLLHRLLVHDVVLLARAQESRLLVFRLWGPFEVGVRHLLCCKFSPHHHLLGIARGA
mmetsp:Transcript_13589/g.26034  ORF Transcript_13589/g.26034 Transcript_13589/m.26034 type:complete len:585 (-) Transcript_13589:111-1865(-)